eukprot:GHVH01001438.1.p1 GENE.GHVH01001438.1~~GHVH01001438.1.p1  ORF type:complete len:799 (-),score=118.13 GHVH01001438.1:53-2449(-)
MEDDIERRQTVVDDFINDLTNVVSPTGNHGAMAIDSNTFASLAVVQMNCHAMDFDGILEQHYKGIRLALEKQASYIVFPELSLCGYSCEDHFLESDTEVHCWGSVNKLLLNCQDDVLIDVGLPVTFRGSRYNCRCYILNGDIIGVRPKCFLAMEGNYRESRYFTSWERSAKVDSMRIQLQEEDGTRVVKEVPFGQMVLKCRDVTIASEICEEMWTPRPLHIDFYLQGVDIVSNASGSHHSLQKLERRLTIIKTATTKTGGVYMYSNFSGNDGTRNCFDGKSVIAMNGDIIASASSLLIGDDVEVLVEEIDITQIRTYRSQSPTGMIQGMIEQISSRQFFLDVPIYICRRGPQCIKRLPDWHARSKMNIAVRKGFGNRIPDCKIQKNLPADENEESMQVASLWLWDYLRRVNGAKGFFLSLSGGSDSASCAAIVFYMCRRVASCVKNQCDDVVRDLCSIMSMEQDEVVKMDAHAICNRLLCTAYQTASASSSTTRQYAKELAKDIGASHLELDISPVFEALKTVVEGQMVDEDGNKPELKFKTQGGTSVEDLCLQNLQSRTRMVLAYAMSSTFPSLIRKARPAEFGEHKDGFLLNIATGNQCEMLRGYYTKYDCSSGDLNPIGSLNKEQIMGILEFSHEKLGLQTAKLIHDALPTAELRPPVDGVMQNDELDMGMTYAEIDAFSYYRMTERSGPLQTFNRLLCEWSHLKARVVAEKVKLFYNFYANNRHKCATVTAGLHMSSRNPDDNRYDHRQLIYPPWSRQFATIDLIVDRLEGKDLDECSDVPCEGFCKNHFPCRI